MNNKYILNINKRIGKTIKNQNLLDADDKILIALSGGKDSMILLDALIARRKTLPFKVDIYAVHVFIENIGYKTDIAYLEEFCKERNVPFYLKRFEVDLVNNKKKSECFICSWNRRKALFEFTRELKCNKLAFGHHMDDALETLFLNMIYHGSISSLPFKLKMFDGRIEVIRPLLEIQENELKKYAEYMGYRKEVRDCPYSETRRYEIKKIIDDFRKIHKISPKNIFRSMDNIYNEYLPHWET